MIAKMLTPVVLLAVVVCCLQISHTDAPVEWRVGQPQFVLEDNHVKIVVPIENHSAAVISIDRIQPGCSCTTADVAESVIHCGQTAAVTLDINLDHLPHTSNQNAILTGVRDFEATARVHGNFTQSLPHRYLELRIPCRVELPVSIGSFISLEPIDVAQPQSSQDISLKVRQGVSEVSVQSETPGVKVASLQNTSATDDGWRNARLTVDFDHQILMDRVRGRSDLPVTFLCTATDAPAGMQSEVTIATRLPVQQVIRMQPSTLQLGPARPGEVIHRKAEVHTLETVRSLTVSLPDNPATVKCKLTSGPLEQNRLTLDMSAAADTPGTHSIRLVATATLESGAKIKVPLFATLYVRVED